MAKEQDLIIKVKAETAKAQKEVEALTEDIKKLNKETKDTGTTSTDVEKVEVSYKKLGSTIKTMAVGAVAVGVALKAVEFARLAGEAEKAEKAFATVFESMGLNAEAEFQKIKDASKGLISETEIRKSVVVAQSLGVPLENMAELMELARVKGAQMGIDTQKAFDLLAKGIASGSTKAIKSLDLTVDLTKANSDYAESIGKSVKDLSKQEKQMALTNAVLKEGEDAVRDLGEAQLQADQEMQKLVAQTEDLKASLGKGLYKAMGDLTKETLKWVESIDPKTIEAFSTGLGHVAEGLVGILKGLSFLNDALIPDWLKKDSGFLGTVAEGWAKIGRAVGQAVDEFDAMFNAQGQVDEMADEVDRLAGAFQNVGETAVGLDQLETQLKDVIKNAEALLEAWRSSDTDLYKDKIIALAKELETAKTILKDVQDKKEAFKPVADSAKDAGDAVDGLGEKVKKYTEEEIRLIGEAHKEILKSQQSKNRTYLSEHKKLNAELKKSEETLAKELQQIATDRYSTEIEYSDKIRDSRQKTLSTYEEYKDKELERDEKLALAKEALKNKEWDRFVQFNRQYETLGLDLARTIITSDGKVLESKEQTHKKEMEVLNTASALYTQYYDAKKQNALDAHDARVAQLNAEIDGTLALIEANKVMIKLLKEFVEATTGKVIEIDTTALDEMETKIKSNQTKMNLLEDQKRITIDQKDLDKSKEKLDEIKTITLNGFTMVVDVDTTPASFGIERWRVTEEKDGTVVQRVSPEWKLAQELLERWRAGEKGKPVKQIADLDNRDAVNKESKFRNEAGKIILTKTEVQVLRKQFDDFVQRTKKPSTHTIKVDNSEPIKADQQNKKNTESIHTIYIRDIDQTSGGGGGGGSWSQGGHVPRFAVGGVFSGSGRVGGYDPYDSDGVNARLTGGEFVIKRSAVDLYGVKLLTAINSMRFPKVKGYAQGGVVSTQSSSTASSQLRPIQLNFGSRSFGVLSPQGVGEALQKFMEQEGGL